jgi:hypothetical protein
VINVVRDNVLEGALRGFGRRSFDPRKPLSVKFCGEDGIDEGGPSREFFRLLLKQVQGLPIFSGEQSRMLILDAASKLSNAVMKYCTTCTPFCLLSIGLQAAVN